MTHEDFTEAGTERSQPLLRAILGPMCEFCGTDIGIRKVHDGWGSVPPEYTCERCFKPTDTGPCFDDLEEPK